MGENVPTRLKGLTGIAPLAEVGAIHLYLPNIAPQGSLNSEFASVSETGDFRT